MAYCYECGSEVAQIDAFCPFCGISLQPFAVAEEEIEVKTEDASDAAPTESAAPTVESVIPEPTAEMTSEEISETAEAIVQPDSEPTSAETDFAVAGTQENPNLRAETAEKVQIETSEEIDEIKVPETEGELFNDQIFGNQTLNERIPALEDFSNIPTPSIIENLENFSAVSAKSESAPLKQPVAPESENSPAAETPENETAAATEIDESHSAKNSAENLIENSTENFEIENKESAPAASSSEVREDEFGAINDGLNKEVEKDEPPLDIKDLNQTPNASNTEAAPEKDFSEVEVKEDLFAPPSEIDFNSTMPDGHSAQAELSGLKPDENGEDFLPVKTTGDFEDSEIPAAAENESESAFENETGNSSAENSIEKPADIDLTPFDPNSSAPSVYDSVRIMEGNDSFDKTPQVEAGNLEPIHTSMEQNQPENKAAETPAASAAPENLSHTTPNIGGSDTDGRKAAKLKPLDEGTILNNRYEIIRKIGGGGMGAVYLASDNNLGGVLRAVKEMVQSYIEEEQQEKSVNDFKRESTILSTLDHNSIPTIYDYFYDEKESRFYLVMKYINGGDLSGRLRAAPEGKIDEKTVTEWSIQIADVLDYLHNRPNTIVYRDLKPANVMIDGNSGRIMLIDFGIARLINKEEKGVTAVGTMGYAPPELFSGNVEPRSDIYSLGSTMFHLLTGADPQSNPLLIFDFQKNPRPRQINSLLSDQIERILMKAVEYNSTARFGSAKDLKSALEEHLENLKAGRVTFGVKEVPQSVSLANQLVFCGFCGQKIVASDMFCAFCGSKQPLSQQGVHAEIYASAPQTAKLMILGTNELESPIFNLEKDESFVGRRDPQSGIFPEVDLSKFDPQTKISRRHARIWRDGGNFLVEDLGSSNGTVVMPSVSDVVRLLPHQPHVLANGDKIRIGDTTLHFVRG